MPHHSYISKYQDETVGWLIDVLSKSSSLNIQARELYTGHQYGISRIDDSMLVLTTSENFRMTRIGLMSAIRASGIPTNHEILCKRFYADHEIKVCRIQGFKYSLDHLEILIVA